MNIGEYTIIGELNNDESGYSKWGFAQKGGKSFFIKEFLSPVFPPDDAPFSNEIINRKRKVCYEFEQKKQALYSRLYQCNTGNIIVVNNFFRNGSKYYITTDLVDSDKIGVEYIANNFTPIQKLVLIKVLTYNVGVLHDHGIIHGDIKPSNVLIKKTTGAYTAKLIDFDSSFLETDPPDYEDLQGDMVYFSPEAFMMLAEECGTLTSKVDVFALGILFHQYYTGEVPYFDTEQYAYAFEAVLDGVELKANKEVPENIAELIEAMLKREPEDRPTLGKVFDVLNGRGSLNSGVYSSHGGYDPVPTPAAETKSGIKPNAFFKKAKSDDLL